MLLTSRRGAQGGRHQSLWAAISWSYDLIQPPLRRFFAGLSVFRGGCTVEAAQIVCGESQALEFLTQLRERSLLLAEDGPGGVRFRPLETLREYAQERLRENGEMSAVRVRHHDFFLALAEEAEPHLAGEGAGTWLVRLEAERDNLRAALDACSVKGGKAGVQAELRLSAALGRFWQARSDQSGYLFAVLAAVALREGKTIEVREHLVEGLTTCRECGDKPSAANLLEFAARLHLTEGHATGAARSLGAAARLRAETSVARDGVEQAKYELDMAGVRAVLGGKSVCSAVRCRRKTCVGAGYRRGADCTCANVKNSPRRIYVSSQACTNRSALPSEKAP